MNYSVQIKVMPLKELLDPQGKAVLGGLQNLGIKAVQDVRIGKSIYLELNAFPNPYILNRFNSQVLKSAQNGFPLWVQQLFQWHHFYLYRIIHAILFLKSKDITM